MGSCDPIIGKRKLNFGCGRAIMPREEGWVNLDIAPLEGVDVVHDVLTFPYPFEGETFDFILASHILEHVPPIVDGKDGLVQVVEELHRILKPGGSLEIRVPHYRRGMAEYFANPTHYRLITPNSFDGFFGKPGTCVSYLTSARFASKKIRDVRRFSILGGRVNVYHLKKYLGLDNLPIFAKPYELVITLQK